MELGFNNPIGEWELVQHRAGLFQLAWPFIDLQARKIMVERFPAEIREAMIGLDDLEGDREEYVAAVNGDGSEYFVLDDDDEEEEFEFELDQPSSEPEPDLGSHVGRSVRSRAVGVKAMWLYTKPSARRVKVERDPEAVAFAGVRLDDPYEPLPFSFGDMPG